MEETIDQLIGRLKYYQSEHGSFEGYIPEVVNKLKSLGYEGSWVLGNQQAMIDLTIQCSMNKSEKKVMEYLKRAKYIYDTNKWLNEGNTVYINLEIIIKIAEMIQTEEIYKK